MPRRWGRRRRRHRGGAVTAEVELADPAVAPDLLVDRRQLGAGERLGGGDPAGTQALGPGQGGGHVGSEGGDDGHEPIEPTGTHSGGSSPRQGDLLPPEGVWDQRLRLKTRFQRGVETRRRSASTSARIWGPAALTMSSAASSSSAMPSAAGSSGVGGVTSPPWHPVHVDEAGRERLAVGRATPRGLGRRGRGRTSGRSRRSRRCGSRRTCTPDASARPTVCQQRSGSPAASVGRGCRRRARRGRAVCMSVPASDRRGDALVTHGGRPRDRPRTGCSSSA